MRRLHQMTRGVVQEEDVTAEENCPEPELSIVIPSFNEERRLPLTLDRITAFLEQAGSDYEIVVVDDGSSDTTAELVKAAAAANRRISLLGYGANLGKGRAVAFGALRARGRLVLFTDADLSTPIEELASLSAHIRQGAAIAIGSRGLPESHLAVRQPWWRERIGRLMNQIIRRLSGLPFSDTQCGFKLFTREAAQTIFSQTTVQGWMFDVEVLLLARKLNFRVDEVPVRWLNSGESRVRISHAPAILRELIHIRTHWLRRTPLRGGEEAELRSQPG